MLFLLESSFQANIQRIPFKHVQEHQNESHENRNHQQEEDQQAVPEGVICKQKAPIWTKNVSIELYFFNGFQTDKKKQYNTNEVIISDNQLQRRESRLKTPQLVEGHAQTIRLLVEGLLV